MGVKLKDHDVLKNKYYYNKYNLSEVLLLNRIHETLTEITLQVIFTEEGRMWKKHHQLPDQSTIS